MRTSARLNLILLAAAVISLHLAAAAARATEISAAASGRVCGLKERLIVEVSVKNPSQASAPVPQPSDDFVIELATGVSNPSYRRSTSIFNNQQTNTEEYLYRFTARPRREGDLMIPSFVLTEQGVQHRTEPIRIHVTAEAVPPPRADVFARIVVARPTAYLGEGVELFLEVYARDYEQEGQRPLNASDTFRMSWDRENSRFGVFESVKKGSVSARYAKLRNDQGLLTNYCVFTWETTVYPTDIGDFDFGDLVIAWNYPTWVVRLFDIRHGQQPRRLRVKPVLPSLEILPLPTEHQPADFNGAVGEFKMRAGASPVRTAAGDPITLSLYVSGNVPLERIGPPRLEQVAALTRDFELSGESLTSELREGEKVFSQTIRALRESVTQVPPVPFSYFDPVAKQYETVWSEPIALDIRAPERVALPDNPDGGSTRTAAPELLESGGIRANHADIEGLLEDQSGGFGALSYALFGGLPLAYAATLLLMRRSARYREDVALQRSVFARSRARKVIDRALAGQFPSDLGAALLGYIADRTNIPAAGLTRAEGVNAIARRAPEKLVQEVDAFLNALEFARYSGVGGIRLEEAASKSRAIIDDLEGVDLR